ncbi:DEAD-domain-containing protein [Atractiella rhizophila]|nr:DEAD-domain-containing protein [Atractiella rhizophila]
MATFSSLTPSLHPTLLSKLSQLRLTTPTSIQSTLIQHLLSSHRDILARSRTGSGKTLAYLLPILHSLLSERHEGKGSDAGTKVLILVPTRELGEQVEGVVRGLWGEEDSVVNACHSSEGGGDRAQKQILNQKPALVISTPSRCLSLLRTSVLSLSHLRYLVIDEADLLLSYGHSAADISSLLSGGWDISPSYQAVVLSATITEELEGLKGGVLRDPLLVDVNDEKEGLKDLTQYCVRCTEEDKFLLLYVILKLKLIKGKSLIFVNTTDRSYKVKLFLEKFGIKSGILNAELPFNSRYHAVQEFNKGSFDYLIATDESGLQGIETDTNITTDEVTDDTLASDPLSGLISTQAPADDTEEAEAEEPPSNPKKRKRKENSENQQPQSKKAKKAISAPSDYGVSRGIDFVDVSCVLNFDLPPSSCSYTHRVGRTARAGRTGISLSFVVPKEKWGLKKQGDISLESAKMDEEIWKRIEGDQGRRGGTVKEYGFDWKAVEGFRYRMEDALKSVTRARVREARVVELRKEAVNSVKLKAHFAENPSDLAFLKHDQTLHPSRIQQHMKHVPSYLMPRISKVDNTNAESASDVRINRDGGKNAARGRGKGGRGRGRGRGKVDPLKKFSKR